VNGLPATSNSISNEYSLVTGNNKFEVSVKAQDGSVKMYTLNVNRSAAIATPDPITPSSEVFVNASSQNDANGAKTLDVLLDTNTLKKHLTHQLRRVRILPL